MARLNTALALVLLAISGCTSPSAPDSPDVLMPLKIGNMWIGERTTITTGGSVTTIDTLRIVGDTSIRGGDVVRRKQRSQVHQ